MKFKNDFFGAVDVVINVGSGGRRSFNSSAGPVLKGSGKKIIQSRALDGVFDCLEVSGFADIEVTRGDECTIEVHGEDNLVDLLETELTGTTLYVGIRQSVSFTTHMPLKVTATAPTVRAVELSGSGDVRMTGLDQPDLRVELRGSGDVTAQGRVDSVTLALQGSGDIDTTRLQAGKVKIKLHGSGDIRAFASEEAKVRLHGAGDVYVKGRPKVRDAKVSGVGDIEFDE